MSALRCSACGVVVAHGCDTRFGLAPAACLCRLCTLPAFTPRLSRMVP